MSRNREVHIWHGCAARDIEGIGKRDGMDGKSGLWEIVGQVAPFLVISFWNLEPG